MAKLPIDVWSDIACPWCYVGKRRLEAALERFPHRDAFQVVYRAFELDPSAPRERDAKVLYAERLARKYGTTPARAQEMIERMTAVGRDEGIAFEFDHIRSGNTFDAHRVLHLAREHGVQDAVKERFFLGYFTEGEPIGEHEALLRLGSDAGLDPDAVASVLSSDQYAKDVRRDEAEAGGLGIQGVPFFVLGGRYAVSGAQPTEVLLGAIERAWMDLAPQSDGVAEGVACGPEECL